MTDEQRGDGEMKSTANAHSLTPVEGQPGEDPVRTATLIQAALSLRQAIEALSSLSLFGELSVPEVRTGISFYEQVSRFESTLLLEALRITDGRQTEAAALLGLKPTTLNCMLKRYGIDPDVFAAARAVRRRAREHDPQAAARGPMRLQPAPAGEAGERAGAEDED
jgi:DNA-binding protein Fis